MRGAVWARRRFRMASNQRCKVSMTTYNLSIAREEGRTPVPPHIAHGICLLITHKGHGNCLVIPLDYDAGDKNRVSFFYLSRCCTVRATWACIYHLRRCRFRSTECIWRGRSLRNEDTDDGIDDARKDHDEWGEMKVG